MKHHKVFHSQLKVKTIALLVQHLADKNNTIVQISKDTELSQMWIGMLSRNQLKHTDVGRVETLYNYLSDIALKV